MHRIDVLVAQDKLNVQFRTQCHEICDRGTELDGAERHGRVHTQETAWGRLQMRNRLIGSIEIGKDGEGSLVVGLSALGRTSPARDPIEKVNPKIVFQVGHVFADRRAREPQLPAGLWKAPKETGRPGTILTFFPWKHAGKGRGGVGQTQQSAFRVPAHSLGYWTHRFVEKGVAHGALEKRFGESVLPFSDPDGMSLSLVGAPDATSEPTWSRNEIPAEHAIRGFHGVTLLLDNAAKTGAVLSGVLGLKENGREDSVIRYRAPHSSQGAIVDIHEAKGFLPGHQGRGSVHHIAFRAKDDAEQAEMARKLVTQHNLHPTEQRNRSYFRSIYFREPGGVLFEIATDVPGFGFDEPLDSLGNSLKLPAFLEPRRKEIEAALPPLETFA
jgi:glyoxalase family protein